MNEGGAGTVTKKYNPGFLTDEQLIESFCVRVNEFDSIVESLRENTGNSSNHSMVIGPRGSGKTHLLLRVAAEMRRDPSLDGFYPVVFAEESYEVSTCGEFWLECLGRLAEGAPADERDELRLSYAALRAENDDQTLALRCLGVLLDFADRHSKRLVLIVENLNMLLSEMVDSEAGWRLRKTLQTEPRMVLLGSATSRFEQIDSPDQALYDLFRVIPLRPLDTAECAKLWSRVSGQTRDQRSIRPLEILTGGNARLIAVVASFGGTYSFRGLMTGLFDLVDDHTEYFKSHLESLPPQERRVYLALARLWKPATTREVADQARIGTSQCSAQLRRLVDRGSVKLQGGTPRRRQYYLTERMYNIYYLLRRPSGERDLVDALIRFMTSYYSPDDLVEFGVNMVSDSFAAGTENRTRELLQLAFRSLLNSPAMVGELGTLITDDSIAARLGAAHGDAVARPAAYALLDHADALDHAGKLGEALAAYDDVIRAVNGTENNLLPGLEIDALVKKAMLLSHMGRVVDAVNVCDEVQDKCRGWKARPFKLMAAWALRYKEFVLESDGRPEQGVSEVRDVAARPTVFKVAPPVEPTFNLYNAMHRGILHYQLGETDAAVDFLDEALAGCEPLETGPFDPIVAHALTAKGLLLSESGRTLSERDASLLLAHLASADLLPPQAVEVLIHFFADVGTNRGLKMILDSGSSDRLLPLVTALRLEAGEQPAVAHEVLEVAADLRVKLSDARARLQTLESRRHTLAGKPDSDAQPR